MQQKFKAVPVDLADFDLPVYDEVEHRARQHYQHEHMKRWVANASAAVTYEF
jgi:hypothetical protein